ncbi:MAG TPA: hypothetical protein VI794_00875 [Patescibacteria group bacterium]|nr:hypothetical protein [Patescibacteria group bacterium]
MSWLSAQRLLNEEAPKRVLTGEEMERVIDWLYGSKNSAAIQFAVARSEIKPALFRTLLTECGIDARKIKTS